MRRFTLFLVFAIALLVSIGSNILMHELAHLAVADSFDLQPRLEFTSPTEMPINTFFSAEYNVAYVTYSSNTNAITDAIIALAGPLTNLLLGLIASIFMISISGKFKVLKLFLLVFATISLLSFAVNILPIAPIDGFYIHRYFFS